MHFLETKYVQLAGGLARNFSRVNERVWKMSCPLCGDSKKNPSKTRGFVTEKNGKALYTCHNQCGSMPFHVFLKRVDPSLYSDYQKERVLEGLWNPTGASRRQSAPTQVVPSSDKAHAHVEDPLRPLTRVDRLPPDHYARKYCEGRMLPNLTKLYHCPYFVLWTNHLIPKKFDKKVKDEPRLVIPFLDKSGKLYAYQGRSYKKDSPTKYITIRVDESIPKIYGLASFDKLRRGYATEGPIDSMFLPNALAFVGGLHTSLNAYVDPSNMTIVYDNEPRSASTKEKMLKAVRDGFSVVVWPKDLEGKDVNKMVEDGMSLDQVRMVIDDNTYSGLRAEAEIALWSRT